jgi:hypothetical protein
MENEPAAAARLVLLAILPDLVDRTGEIIGHD